MAVCAHGTKGNLPDNFPVINTLDVNGHAGNAFKHFMGTFLLRRAYYFDFGGTGNQSLLPTRQSLVK